MKQLQIYHLKRVTGSIKNYMAFHVFSFSFMTSTKSLPLETLCKCKTGKRRKKGQERKTINQKSTKLCCHHGTQGERGSEREKKHQHTKTGNMGRLGVREVENKKRHKRENLATQGINDFEGRIQQFSSKSRRELLNSRRESSKISHFSNSDTCLWI